MTGAPPVQDRPALWAALSHMPIEMPGGRFEDALAETQGWTAGFAGRVTDEYRRFLYLAATAGFEVTPSRAVDQAWHLHLDLPHYRDVLCELILGRPLEHRPATGEPGEEERHRRQYADTLALYERAFGRAPPLDIWPDSPVRKESRPTRSRAAVLAFRMSAAAAAAAVLAWLLDFPATSLVLASTALVFALPPLLVSSLKAQSGTAGCGGGIGGSSDPSCGGGGGGCGGD